MKKDLGKKTIFFPLPVLIIASYDEENKPNAMNAAWGGIHDTDEIFLCLSSDHKTTKNIKLKNAFTVSFADKKHVIESDYFGVKSGNNEDKITKAKMHVSPSKHVDAPVIEEYPLTLECKVKELKEENDTAYVIASIVNVLVDDSVLNEKGQVDVDKLEMISYEPIHHHYHVMGESVGNAFKDGLKIK